MPSYEYACGDGHITPAIRRMDARHDPFTCPQCQQPAHLIISRPAGSPDGIYSYAPNIGDPDRFERQRHAIKAGQKVIPREPKMDPAHRDGQLTSRRA